MTSTASVRLFISHSHEDDDFGRRLVQDLRTVLDSDESAVWYDSQGGLRGGDSWWQTIQAEIEARSVFIVILSPASMNSEWVRNEIDIAWALRNAAKTKGYSRIIIPVIWQACDIRPDLRTLQHVSFRPPNTYEMGFQELLEALGVHSSELPGSGQTDKYRSHTQSDPHSARGSIPGVEVNGRTKLSRHQLFQAVRDLLTENKVIYDQFGPESMLAKGNPLSDAASLWNERKRAVIIPNNQAIIDILQDNRDLLTQNEYQIFLRFREHALAFAKSAKERLDREASPRFPQDFRLMVEKGLSENE